VAGKEAVIGKVCSRPTCLMAGELQPLENFRRNSDHADGRRAECRDCAARQGRATRFDIDVDASTLPASGFNQRLFEATKKSPATLAELCDTFDLSPKKMREAIRKAQASGLPIHLEHDRAAFAPPGPSRVPAVVIPPVVA